MTRPLLSPLASSPVTSSCPVSWFQSCLCLGHTLLVPGPSQVIPKASVEMSLPLRSHTRLSSANVRGPRAPCSSSVYLRSPQECKSLRAGVGRAHSCPGALRSHSNSYVQTGAGSPKGRSGQPSQAGSALALGRVALRSSAGPLVRRLTHTDVCWWHGQSL